MKEFQHGGDVKSFARKAKCQVKEVIDLSSNINFLKPKLDIDFNSLDISSYPNYDKLYKAISKHYNVMKSQIELYNGGSSAIFKLFENLKLKHCTIYSPAYLEYKKAAQNFGYEIELINRFKDMKKEVKKGSFVIFVNPSTPDAKCYNINELLNFWIKKECTILIDESFLEFTDYESTTKYLGKYDKLYILKSMTKFYSSAGIRVGTIISSKENIIKLREKEPMWKISTFDMNYLIEVLKYKKFYKKAKKRNKENLKLLCSTLEKHSFIKMIHQSEANYILVKLKGIKAKELQEKLLPYKIMIRDCSNFDFLGKKHIRIAVKSKKSIELLNKAFEDIAKCI
ncbi:aminotransferase class I/II-fold pyridoxal phosphate-dependent enzyme [Halarcobacter bivalviorum]|uniref:aminotransferase class I/II-fold pyridoxal phosphate-dependent enzyme n=1 Tax=Halarcobacter bivalviorum TaxID=663364 RepID=UPI00100A3D26|nr:aminotransferase class I/II-fold pyridoxal phosphate-dependent enzyme [Halarcobacter bivalviorum]RXK07876.1 aminotransferase class I/II [Halarcobacter bivalviorum]